MTRPRRTLASISQPNKVTAIAGLDHMLWNGTIMIAAEKLRRLWTTTPDEPWAARSVKNRFQISGRSR